MSPTFKATTSLTRSPVAYARDSARLVLEVAGGGDQVLGLVRAQYHRQLARQVHWLHLGHQLGMVEGDVKEKLQSADGGVERGRRDVMIDQARLVIAQVFDAGAVRRASQVLREVAHGGHVIQMCLVAELPHPHVVEHALTQRADRAEGMQSWWASRHGTRRIASFHKLGRGHHNILLTHCPWSEPPTARAV